MTIIVAQRNITQTLTLSQADILALFSSRFVLAPAVSNFINVFEKASVSSRFNTTPFSTVNNVLTFKVGSTIVSNSLNGLNVLGLSQNTNVNFIPANPYASVMSSDVNSALTFGIDTANPTGGNSASSVIITFTYSILQLT